MKVLIVEPDMKAARDLGQILQAKACTFEVVLDEADVLEKPGAAQSDVIIFHSESRWGRKTLEYFRESGLHTPVIIISSKDDWREKTDYLDSGADDYLTVPFHPEELFVRLRALARRGKSIIGPVIKIGDLTVDMRAKKAWGGDRKILLTWHQYLILEYLARHGGTIVDRITLHEAICGEETQLQNITVHIHRINKKLREVNVRQPSIEGVIGMGYVLR